MNMSVALGDPDLFTNALANQYLPFIVDWDTMTEEEKEDMLDFWGALEGGSPFETTCTCSGLAFSLRSMHVCESLGVSRVANLLRVGTWHSQSGSCRVDEGGC